MFPEEIVYEVVERQIGREKEWAFNIRIDGGTNWTITTWKRKPSESEVEKALWIVQRSMAVFVRYITLPSAEIKFIKCEGE